MSEKKNVTDINDAVNAETDEERERKRLRALDARMMEIAFGISHGKTPKELGISDEWEEEVYRRIKEQYDTVKAMGTEPVWSPVCGGPYDDW